MNRVILTQQEVNTIAEAIDQALTELETSEGLSAREDISQGVVDDLKEALEILNG